MSSPESRWWSVRAGEYVLGTLRGKDRELFERIVAHDTELQEEVARWERRLGPLNETVAEQRPGEQVWPRVLERIRAGGPERGVAGVTDVAPSVVGDADRASPISRIPPARGGASPVRGGSRLWPALALLSTAASLVLAVALYQRAALPPAAPLAVDGLAVVLSDENGTPYFLVETDRGNLRVRVTALTPPSIEEDRDFRLWQALPDRSAVRPVALLPERSGASRIFEVDSLVEGSDLFGVSIEPVGAPTDSGPTGPVVAHGDFLERHETDASR